MTERVKLYKVLELDRITGLVTSPYQGTRYNQYLPKDGKPGKWTRKLKYKPHLCVYGYHLTTRPDRHINTDSAAVWANGERARVSVVYEAQGSGRAVKAKAGDKQAFQSVRLLREIPRSRWHKVWLLRTKGYKFV